MALVGWVDELTVLDGFQMRRDLKDFKAVATLKD